MKTQYYTASTRAITNPSLRLVSVRQLGAGFAELHYEVPRRGGS